MTESESRVAAEEALLEEARARGPLATLGAWVRLSGPGWLQSAITLGGGSLASALYLGVLTGFRFLWLQVLAMALGVVMLGAIGYVTLATGERPFRAINKHVNPVLGWGWLLAVMLANLVWSLPQFALGTAAVQQNLIPGLEGQIGKGVTCAGILLLALAVVWSYDRGRRGIRLFEWVLKALVGLVVLCFFGVVVTLTFNEPGLPWREILAGFVPDPGLIFEPSSTYTADLAAAGEFRGWWSERIVNEQRKVMIAAAATAVGINMTFLLPYSMLRKGWTRTYRGLAIFDLATGLLIPFVLATSCVVIASASQFHGRHGMSADGEVPARQVAGYVAAGRARLAAELGPGTIAALSDEALRERVDALPAADRRLAAMLVRRDAFDLAAALEPFAGRTVSRYVFGIGVLAMAVSTVIILMLINGFAFCEALGAPLGGRTHRLGVLMVGIGVLGPFVWSTGARFWLAVPTSVFGMVLLPIAYWTFFFMMNSKRLLGDDRPTGARRVKWNVLMLLAVGIVTPAALWSAWTQARWYGLGAVAAFAVLALVVGLRRR